MEYSELQKYLLKNMKMYHNVDKHGFAVFGWNTALDLNEIQSELPTGFVPINSCQFEDARAWVNHLEKVIMTWRIIPLSDPIVNLYRFKDIRAFASKWRSMAVHPEKWYVLSGSE